MAWLLWGNPIGMPKRERKRTFYVMARKISTEKRPNRNGIANVMVIFLFFLSSFCSFFLFLISWYFCGAIHLEDVMENSSSLLSFTRQYIVLLFLDFIFKNSIYNVIVVIRDILFSVCVRFISGTKLKNSLQSPEPSLMHRKRNREKKIYPIMNYLKIKIKMLKQKRNAWWSHTQHTISHMYSIQYVHVPSANVFPKQVWQHCDLRAHSSYSLGRWDSSVSPEISFVSHTHTHTPARDSIYQLLS